MGYCISVDCDNFSFDLAKADEILEAIKEGIASQKITEENWIDFNVLLHSRTVEEAFEELRFETRVENGKYYLEFCGEKLGGYEKSLFECIAPYVNDGYLEYLGEDGDRWRYVFKNRKCKEVCPNISWD